MGSIPTFGTEKGFISERIEAFFDNYKLLWHQTVAEKHPYKLARIIHHNHNLKKRWYVVFYAWSVSECKLVRKRLFDPINRKKTVLERLTVAQGMVAIINNDLRSGKVLGKSELQTDPIKTNIIKMSLIESIHFFISEKKSTGHRKGYYRTFDALISNLEQWMQHESIDDFNIRKLTPGHVQSFFSYLNKVKKLGNKTYNNYRNNFSTHINFLLKRHPALFARNPLQVIDVLPVISRKHAAYTDAQVSAIKSECNKEPDYKQLLLFIQFIYYSLGRPKEIVQLKISDIDLTENRIFFRGENSKNKNDEYVGINPNFRKIIMDSGILTYDKNMYVFGYQGHPGDKVVTSSTYFWKRNRAILKKLGYYELNDNYTMYGYKHSGAISLYKATKDIKLVQRQCRHSSIEQTNTYLRDLGVLDDNKALQKWKGAI